MARDEDRQEDRSNGSSDEEPEERTDGWMTTYADMVTLLMTFFVLMFAISNVDQQKAMLFFGSMSQGGLTAEQFQDILAHFEPGDDPDLITFPPLHPDDDEEYEGHDDGSGAFGNEELDELFMLISDYVLDNELGNYIVPTFNGDFLLLTLANDIWFETGRAEITPAMRDIAVVIAQLIAQTHNEDKPFEIIVAGHTDNVPINTVRFPSNWHVSVARAVNFLEVLVVESGLDPGFFYSRGCGEYRPIADNDTSEGRQQNRRVEVMISLPREDERRDGTLS